jgi:hypothetical protein
MSEFNSKHFSDFQFGLKSKGCEQIILSIALGRELNPDFDLYVIDASNAFNLSNRAKGLEQVLKHQPGLFPFIRAMYLDNSAGWYRGLSDFIKDVTSSCGYHQGDVLASWLYIMTNQPLLSLIDETVTKEHGDCDRYQYWYIDDGNIHASHEVMQTIINVLRDHGPEYGYNINFKKGGYLVGKCNSLEEAEKRRATLNRLYSIPENIVHINPSDYMDYPEEIAEEDKVKYGVKVLGSFIGTDEYVKDQLNKYLIELQGVAEKLKGHEDLQERMLLLRWCYAQKPNHIFRTIPNYLSHEFAMQFEKEKLGVLCSILQVEQCVISGAMEALVQFPIADGGLGLHSSGTVSRCAFIASVFDLLEGPQNSSLKRLVRQYDEEALWTRSKFFELFITQGDWLRRVHNGVEDGAPVEDAMEGPVEMRHVDMVRAFLREFWEGRVREERSNESMQHMLCGVIYYQQLSYLKTFLNEHDINHYNWFIGTLNKEAGKWLEAIPTHAKLKMESCDYRTALRYRLHMQFENWSPDLICCCKWKTKIDKHGDHLAVGCGKLGVRFDVHDGLVRELHRLLTWAGHKVKEEPKSLFVNGEANDTQKQPDLLVSDFGPNNQKLLLDVTIRSTAQYERESGARRNVKAGVGAADVFGQKNDKYRDLAGRTGDVFVPIVFESCGLMHADSVKVLKQLADKFEKDLKCRKGTIMNYMLKSLSVCLQMGMAKALKKKYFHIVRSTVPYAEADDVALESSGEVY